MNISDFISNPTQAVQDMVDIATEPALTCPMDAEKAIETLKDGALAAGSWALDRVLDDSTWGDEIGVDGFKRPTLFGYGTDKQTLGEIKLGPAWTVDSEDYRGWDVQQTHELAAKLRTFGHASLNTLSASIGVETETGYHGTHRLTTPDGSNGGDADIFAGIRGRLFAELGALGSGVGGEAFLGFAAHQQQEWDNMGSGTEDWKAFYTQVEIGIKAAVTANLDFLGAELAGRVQAGLDYRHESLDHDPLALGLGLMHRHRLNVFIGAMLEGAVSAGPTGLSAGVDAFAGVRVRFEKALSLAFNGSDVFGVVGHIEGRLGIGASANVKAGFDWDKKEFGLSGDAGVAVGVGLSLGGGVKIGGKEITKAVGLGE